MVQAYRLVYSYSFTLFHRKLTCPWNWTGNRATVDVDIRDTNKLSSAVLRGYVHYTAGNVPVPPFPRPLMRVLFNGNEVVSERAPKCEARHFEVNIMGFVNEGFNTCTITIGNPHGFWATAMYSVVLDLEYEEPPSKPPEVKPPSPPFPEWWQIAVYGGLAIAGVGVVAYLIRSLR